MCGHLPYLPELTAARSAAYSDISALSSKDSTGPSRMKLRSGGYSCKSRVDGRMVEIMFR